MAHNDPLDHSGLRTLDLLTYITDLMREVTRKPLQDLTDSLFDTLDMLGQVFPSPSLANWIKAYIPRV